LHDRRRHRQTWGGRRVRAARHDAGAGARRDHRRRLPHREGRRRDRRRVRAHRRPRARSGRGAALRVARALRAVPRRRTRARRARRPPREHRAGGAALSRGSGNGTSEARPGGAERRRSRAWIAAAPALGSGEWLLWPDGLPLLLLVPLAWLALAARDRARARRLEALAGPRAARSARGAWSRRLRRTLLAGGFGFALLALLQPAFGPGEQHGVPRGLDLVVCLDLSRSMLARDVAPSRLARARAEIRALAERVRGDRLALVTFAG